MENSEEGEYVWDISLRCLATLLLLLHDVNMGADNGINRANARVAADLPTVFHTMRLKGEVVRGWVEESACFEVKDSLGNEDVDLLWVSPLYIITDLSFAVFESLAYC